MGWNYLSIARLQRLRRWGLGMDKYFHRTHHNARNYLSVSGLKLIHVSKMGPRCRHATLISNFKCFTPARIEEDCYRLIIMDWTYPIPLPGSSICIMATKRTIPGNFDKFLSDFDFYWCQKIQIDVEHLWNFEKNMPPSIQWNILRSWSGCLQSCCQRCRILPLR